MTDSNTLVKRPIVYKNYNMTSAIGKRVSTSKVTSVWSFFSVNQITNAMTEIVVKVTVSKITEKLEVLVNNQNLTPKTMGVDVYHINFKGHVFTLVVDWGVFTCNNDLLIDGYSFGSLKQYNATIEEQLTKALKSVSLPKDTLVQPKSDKIIDASYTPSIAPPPATNSTVRKRAQSDNILSKQITTKTDRKVSDIELDLLDIFTDTKQKAPSTAIKADTFDPFNQTTGYDPFS